MLSAGSESRRYVLPSRFAQAPPRLNCLFQRSEVISIRAEFYLLEEAKDRQRNRKRRR